MQKCPPFTVLTLALLAGALPMHGGTATPAALVDFSKLDAQIEHWIGEDLYPGASMLVVQNNQVVFERYYGSYLAERSNTVEKVASAGKWVAAATIMTLVDEGKLSLDRPASDYLDAAEFTGKKGDITLRQMLSHTSGLSSGFTNRLDDFPTLAGSLAEINAYDLIHTPGSRFEYGGMAFQVAGRIAEIAGGRDWESLFQERIAQPLGMENSHYVPVDPTRGHGPMLAGGLRTTPADYGRFLSMLFHYGVDIKTGRRILSEAAVKEMEADQVRGATLSGLGNLGGPLRNNGITGVYGLGCWREVLNDQGVATSVSSPSWAGAYPWINREIGVYGLFMAHVDREAATAWAEKNGVSRFNSFKASVDAIPGLAQDALQTGQKPKKPADKEGN